MWSAMSADATYSCVRATCRPSADATAVDTGLGSREDRAEMPRWRLSTWLLILWTIAMLAWLVR